MVFQPFIYFLPLILYNLYLDYSVLSFFSILFIIIDFFGMEKLNGIETTKEILTIDPNAKLLITTFQDDEYISSALSLGCKRYILKQNIQGIIPAINVVYSDNYVFDSKTVSNIQRHSNKNISKELTNREFDILLLVAEGLNNKEIADRLYLSSSSVRNRTQITIYYYKL